MEEQQLPRVVHARVCEMVVGRGGQLAGVMSRSMWSGT